MGYNYAKEKYKLLQGFKKEMQEYKKAGVAYIMIIKLYKLRKEEFKNNRKFYTHTQFINDSHFSDKKDVKEDRSPLMKKHLEKLSFTEEKIEQYGCDTFIDKIGTPNLQEFIKTLPENDIELLSMLCIDDMKQKEIAIEQGRSSAAVSKQKSKIKEKARKWLSSEVGRPIEPQEIKLLNEVNGLHKFIEILKNKVQGQN
ncbi:sigma-70 family RNA polymerase sigma factor [Lachnospiraceae bacterium]|nr:sigma-70 family RNA polymerase sigma factor [Lachnospiraceae bacterium]